MPGAHFDFLQSTHGFLQGFAELPSIDLRVYRLGFGVQLLSDLAPSLFFFLRLFWVDIALVDDLVLEDCG